MPAPFQEELALQSLLVPAPPPRLRLLVSLSHCQSFQGGGKGATALQVCLSFPLGQNSVLSCYFLSPLFLLASEKISCQIRDAKADKSSAPINNYSRAIAIMSFVHFCLHKLVVCRWDFLYQARSTNTDPQQAVKYSLNKTQCQQIKEEEYAE